MPYVKRTWNNETITDAKLQQIEDGLEDVYDNGSVSTAMLAANAASQIVTAASTAQFSTSSTSFVDVTDVTLNITTTGGPLLVILSGGGFGNDTGGNSAIPAVHVNGTANVVGHSSIGGGAYGLLSGLVVVTGLAAGTYTVKLQLRIASSGSAYCNAGGSSRTAITAIELKR